jgi:pyruvate/2-oxoglutarate dehydrogenase complex dihydrolipoamide acyltransferase (E2) component
MSVEDLNNEWRKVASSVYRKPVDSKIFGSVEVDVTDLETYISAKRKEGIKITLTHFFTLAVARALRHDVPELNCYIRRGNVVSRKQVDALVSVLNRKAEMSSVRVYNADRLSYQSLSEVFNQSVQNSRQGVEDNTMQMKGVLGRIPWPFRGWLFSFVKFLTVSIGISMPAIGLTANNFGSFVITNIGSIGLDTGFPALFPVSNVAMVFVMGGVSKKPVVVNDKVVIRRIISLSCALDHRVVDASHGGTLFKSLKNAVRNPGLFEGIRAKT